MTESPAVPPMQPADVPLTAQSLEVSLTVAAVRPGAVRILLTQEDGAKGVNRLKGEGFSFQITTLQPIDAIAGRANQAGAVLDLETHRCIWCARLSA